MRLRKLLLFVSLPILLVPLASSVAHAQARIEVTPFYGARFGGHIDVNAGPIDFLQIKSGSNYGLMGDVSVWRHFYFEFMWNRQPTTLSAHDAATGLLATVAPDTTIDMYQFSALYQFRSYDAKLRPFIVGGGGFAHINSQGVLDFSNRFTFNFGTGLKYFFDPHLGLRAEVRYSPFRTTVSRGIYCDPFFGCFPSLFPNYAEQGQANVGLIFRF